MGRNVSANIYYGFPVIDHEDLGTLQPWEKSCSDEGIKEWWERINGFDSAYDLLVTEDGDEWLPGVSEEDKQRAYQADRDWRNAHPAPFEVEYEGSRYGETRPFLKVSGTPEWSTHWSHKEIDPEDMVIGQPHEANLIAVRQLIAEHNIAVGPEGWYLVAEES